MRKLTKNELAFSLLSWNDQYDWRQKALQRYNDVHICPVCSHFLTGLHERSGHFQTYLNKVASNMWAKEFKKQATKGVH